MWKNILSIAALGLGLAHCAAAAGARYHDDLQGCVERATTREQADLCAAHVRGEWQTTDAGKDGAK